MARPEPDWCLLEQGFVCIGLGDARRLRRAVHQGRSCPAAAVTGPSGTVEDQGAAMLSAIGSLIDAVTEERAAEIVAQIADPVGTF